MRGDAGRVPGASRKPLEAQVYGRRMALSVGGLAALAGVGAAMLPAGAAEASGTSISGFFDVTSYGAKGDGTTDDTAAIQSAINAAGGYGLVWFPQGTYLISSALLPPSNQRLLFAGALQPAGANAVLSFNNVFNVHVEGSLQIDDPNGVSGAGTPLITFNGARNITIERMFFNNCASLIQLRNTNQCELKSVFGQTVRGTGIQIVGYSSDPAGVHDNAFGHIFLSGASGSANGIDFQVQAGTNVVGGNHFGDVAVLSMGGNGVSFASGAQIEVWFDTLLVDTCSGDGVQVQAGTQRIFIGTLWASTNGNNGLETIGSASAQIQDIEIGNLYAHGNQNYGVLVNGYTTRLGIGKFILQGNGLSGCRVVDNSSHIHVSQTVTYGNDTSGSGGHFGVDDGGDSSSGDLWFYQMDTADGYSLSAASNVHIN